MAKIAGIGSDRTTLNEKQEIGAFRIGIIKKNQDLRNAILSRNIGRYEQYDGIMTPGIGEDSKVGSNEDKLPNTVGDLLHYTHGRDNDKTELRQEIDNRYGEIFKKYYQVDNLAKNTSLPWRGKYGDYINYMVQVRGVEGYDDGKLTLGDAYDALVDLLKYTDASYMARDMAVGVVRNINVPSAMNGVITTNVSNMSGEDTKMGEISNKVYSNTLYNASLINNSRSKQYITNTLSSFVGNTAYNVGSLASLFPISEHDGRTYGAYDGTSFIKEYDSESDASAFNSIIDAEGRNESFTTVSDFQSGFRYSHILETEGNVQQYKEDWEEIEEYLNNPYYISDFSIGKSVNTVGKKYKDINSGLVGTPLIHTSNYKQYKREYDFELPYLYTYTEEAEEDKKKKKSKRRDKKEEEEQSTSKTRRKNREAREKKKRTEPKEKVGVAWGQFHTKEEYEDRSRVVHEEIIPEVRSVKYAEKGIQGDIPDSANDLLGKTNRMFKKGMIKTLISRFSDEENNELSLIQSAVSNHGVSRGRNLFKKFEGLGVADHLNVNKSKYCRVWTMTHQYRDYEDAIRGQGLEYTIDRQQLVLEHIGQRDNRFWSSYSVLNNNGTVSIAPHKDMETRTQDIKIKPILKKCTNDDITSASAFIHKYMFSIENLAWKDSDEFVTSLNPSQRGPNGGRIMWFPPYNLKFSEQISPEWEPHSFIGRGEHIYSYKNTTRGGNLSFSILIDHPSNIDVFAHENRSKMKDEDEMDLLRFFAGCGELEVKKDTKRKTIDDTVCELQEVEKEVKEEEMVEITVPEPKTTLEFYVFFPNNFSGMDYNTEVTENPKIKYHSSSGTTYAQDAMAFKPIEYLIHGHGTQITDNGPGYEMSDVPLFSYDKDWDKVDYTKDCYPYSVTYDGRKHKQAWHYRVDYNTVNQNVGVSADAKSKRNNFMDTKSFKLNSDISQVRKLSDGIMKNKETPEDSQNPHFLPDKNAYVLSLKDMYDILNSKPLGTRDLEDLQEMLSNPKTKVLSLSVKGYASSHGNSASNEKLAKNRASTVYNWLKETSIGNLIQDVQPGTEHEIIKVNPNSKNVSSEGAKKGRAVRVFMEFQNEVEEAKEETDDANGIKEAPLRPTQTEHPNELYKRICIPKERREPLINLSVVHNEYKYFEDIAKQKSPLFDRIIDKVKYFDPAFHALTPEGFNARLNFLHQCTRQGPTCSVTDKKGFSAGNLAFGRPPYCVLRIGDFYHTKILIESVNIDYADNQWDLNPEGIGVQPIMANVDISFKFLGGSDIGGPINRLQNAVSFNYYANTSVYDDRAISPLMEKLHKKAKEEDSLQEAREQAREDAAWTNSGMTPAIKGQKLFVKQLTERKSTTPLPQAALRDVEEEILMRALNNQTNLL